MAYKPRTVGEAQAICAEHGLSIHALDPNLFRIAEVLESWPCFTSAAAENRHIERLDAFQHTFPRIDTYKLSAVQLYRIARVMGWM